MINKNKYNYDSPEKKNEKNEKNENLANIASFSKKIQHIFENTPDLFFELSKDMNKDLSEKEIYEFNIFYHGLSSFLGHITNYYYNTIENSNKLFICEFKIYSINNPEIYIYFKLIYPKDADIKEFEYIPIENLFPKEAFSFIGLDDEIEFLKVDSLRVLTIFYELRKNY